MSTLTEADRFLLKQIRAGDADAWSQLVDRYQGRLVSFARSRVRNADDAEDLVQEAFMSFLRSVDRYEERASIETYLFTILRRRIIDHMRGRHLNVCLLSDTAVGLADDSRATDPMNRVAGSDPTASFYMRREEARDATASALAEAMGELIEGYKSSSNFRDLQIAEMLFYAQMRNKDIASIMSIREQHVALIKHRCVKQVRQVIGDAPSDQQQTETESTALEDGMLTRVWEDGRLSCPKRSTIGAWMLGTLDDAWRDYVAFHVDRLGCRFCQANLDDLKQKNEGRDKDVLRERIMQSTVGFLKRS